MRLRELLTSFDDALEWVLDHPLHLDEPLLADHEPPSQSAGGWRATFVGERQS